MLSRCEGFTSGFFEPLEEMRVKSMVFVTVLTRRVVPISALSMVSGPECRNQYTVLLFK